MRRAAVCDPRDAGCATAAIVICALLAATGCGSADEAVEREAASAGGEGVCLDEPEVSATSAPGVHHATDAERRTSPPGTAEVAILARGQNAFVASLEIAASAQVPEHRDASEEYIVVLSGSGELTLDGVTSEVRAGDTIYMPANALVSFRNGPTPMRAIQIFAGPESAEKYARWAPVEPPEEEREAPAEDPEPATP